MRRPIRDAATDAASHSSPARQTTPSPSPATAHPRSFQFRPTIQPRPRLTRPTTQPDPSPPTEPTSLTTSSRAAMTILPDPSLAPPTSPLPPRQAQPTTTHLAYLGAITTPSANPTCQPETGILPPRKRSLPAQIYLTTLSGPDHPPTRPPLGAPTTERSHAGRPLVTCLASPAQYGGGGGGVNRSVGGGLGVGLGRTGKLRAALADVPADELADHCGAVAVADELAEGSPQLGIDPDGAVFGVGVLHMADGSRCIYSGDSRGVAVYIHTRYSRGYTRWDQVPWQAGVCTRETGGLFRMLENISPLRDAAHLRCRHKHYRLTCAQFDGLLIEARGRCQVCRTPGGPDSRAMLFIDHDAYRGDWAVRGLLCNRCNTILGKDLEVPRDDAFAEYLANAWFIRMLAAHGVKPDIPDEPPVGAVVHLGDRRPRMWRSPKGWVRTGRTWPGLPRTWRELYRSAGPHKLMVVSHRAPRRGGRW